MKDVIDDETGHVKPTAIPSACYWAIVAGLVVLLRRSSGSLLDCMILYGGRNRHSDENEKDDSSATYSRRQCLL